METSTGPEEEAFSLHDLAASFSWDAGLALRERPRAHNDIAASWTRGSSAFMVDLSLLLALLVLDINSLTIVEDNMDIDIVRMFVIACCCDRL